MAGAAHFVPGEPTMHVVVGDHPADGTTILSGPAAVNPLEGEVYLAWAFADADDAEQVRAHYERVFGNTGTTYRVVPITIEAP